MLEVAASVIVADKVTKVFEGGGRRDQVVALENLSLEVAEGEFVCLVGGSGCGKTTFLNLVAGFLAPTDGVIYLRGRAIDGIEPRAGMIFQSYALLPWKTVAGNVEFGPKMKRLPKAERRAIADRFIQMVGLQRLRAFLSRPAVGRDAAAGDAGAAPRGGPGGVPDGRAVRRAGRDDPPGDAGGADPHPRAEREDDGLRDAQHRRGPDPRRSDRRDVFSSGPLEGLDPERPAAPATRGRSALAALPGVEDARSGGTWRRRSGARSRRRRAPREAGDDRRAPALPTAVPARRQRADSRLLRLLRAAGAGDRKALRRPAGRRGDRRRRVYGTVHGRAPRRARHPLGGARGQGHRLGRVQPELRAGGAVPQASSGSSRAAARPRRGRASRRSDGPRSRAGLRPDRPVSHRVLGRAEGTHLRRALAGWHERAGGARGLLAEARGARRDARRARDRGAHRHPLLHGRRRSIVEEGPSTRSATSAVSRARRSRPARRSAPTPP